VNFGFQQDAVTIFASTTGTAYAQSLGVAQAGRPTLAPAASFQWSAVLPAMSTGIVGGRRADIGMLAMTVPPGS
jgi:hypothetical protein